MGGNPFSMFLQCFLYTVAPDEFSETIKCLNQMGKCVYFGCVQWWGDKTH